MELGLASSGDHSAPGAPKPRPWLQRLDAGAWRAWKLPGQAGAHALSAMLAQNGALLRLDMRRNGVTELGRSALVAGLERNTTLQQLLLDGKQDRRIAALLERNRALSPQAERPARDVALIRSVYRGA